MPWGIGGFFYWLRHFVSFRGPSGAAVIFISFSLPCMVKYNSHTDMNNKEQRGETYGSLQ